MTVPVVGVGLVCVLATLVGVAWSGDMAWSLHRLGGVTGRMGVAYFGLYVGSCLILTPFALSWALGVVGRSLPQGALLGFLGGLTWAVYLLFLQFSLAFIGEAVSVPGVPMAMTLFGDERWGVIVAAGLVFNGASYGGLGALFGFLAARRARRADGPSSLGVRTPDRRAARRFIRLSTVASGIAVLILTAVLWPQGPGWRGWDAFLAQFDLVPGVRYHRGLVYARAGETDLRLDLCVPEASAEARPAVLCIHGGGWHGGVRSEYTPLIVLLARRGYVAASVSYRLAPAHRFPAQIEDVAAAVRWLRANAEQYNIDPNRIGVLGWSAGGHLACLLGVNARADAPDGIDGSPGFSSRVQAVVSFSGLTDLTAEYWDPDPSGTRTLIGATRHENPHAYRQASPLTHVDGDDPPFLLLHGAGDPVVPVDQSERMHRRLRAVGVVTSLKVFPGVGHRWYGSAAREARQDAIAFLDRYLMAPGKP